MSPLVTVKASRSKADQFVNSQPPTIGQHPVTQSMSQTVNTKQVTVTLLAEPRDL